MHFVYVLLYFVHMFADIEIMSSSLVAVEIKISLELVCAANENGMTLTY